MELNGTLSVSWLHGLTQAQIYYIDEENICYICGNNIKFMNTKNKETKVFAGRGNAITALATHPAQSIFAVADASSDIYVCEYPSMQVLKTLKGCDSVEYGSMAFSFNECYLASYCGAPHFSIHVWDWSEESNIAEYQLCADAETSSLSFSPLNWHEICAFGPQSISVLFLEKYGNTYKLDGREIILPEIPSDDSHDDFFQYVSRTRNQLSLPLSARAKLVGPEANNFKAPQQRKAVVEPKSHCWTAKGQLYIGCNGGQLVSIQTETSNVTLLLSRSQVEEGIFNTMCFNSLGLFCGGRDGILRKIIINKSDIRISKEYEGTMEIVTANLSWPSFNNIAFGTSTGSIHVFNIKKAVCSNLLESHSKEFISAGFSDEGSTCLSCGNDGTIELWETESGKFISALKIGEKATSFGVCPSFPLAAVGAESGNIYQVDIKTPGAPRLVSKQYLLKESVDCVQYSPQGLHLICCSKKASHVFIIDARPSSKFQCIGFVDCFGIIKDINGFHHDDGRTHYAVVLTPMTQNKQSGEELVEDSLTSDRILLFSIPNDCAAYDLDSYNTILNDFKDDFIQRLTFDLTLPLDSAVISDVDSFYHIFALGLDDRKMLQFKFPTSQDDNLSVYNPSQEVEGHQMQNGSLIMSHDGEWIVSYSPDGSLMLRRKSNLASFIKVKAHSYLSGGVSFAALSSDSQKILSCGKGDGAFTCIAWNLTSKGRLSMNSSLEFARNWHMTLRAIAENEDSALTALPIWKESESNSSTNTWYEEQVIKANQKENMEYHFLKGELRLGIDELRKMIFSMMSENEMRPETEQLNQEEYNLDVEQLKKLQDMEEGRLEKVQEEIEFKNLAEQFLKFAMQKEFWDEMVVKGHSIKAFNVNASISNYAMQEIIQSDVILLGKLSRIRAAEIEELKARKEIIEISPGQTIVEEEDDDDEDSANSINVLSLHGSIGPRYGGGNEMFYTQFDLHTREEKISQIFFLKNAIHKMKNAFNKEFMSVYQLKEQEIARAKEKNLRIREILEDLEMDTVNIKDIEMTLNEKPEKILNVLDEEVTVERILSLEQQRLLEYEKEQEQARLEAAKKDNKRERGLHDMMGGVLDVKKEDILKQDITTPEFIAEKPESEWTEDEKRALKEFEKKKKDLLEERDKHRKNLENELKKLQQAVLDGMVSFDEQLMQLYNRKMKTEMAINQEESKVLRLMAAILTDEEIRAHELRLNVCIQLTQERKMLMANNETEMRKLVDEYREIYDSSMAEDKLLDRAFKRDFSDIPVAIVDSLYRLFKRRPRIQRMAGEDLDSFNPYTSESRGHPPAGTRAIPSLDNQHTVDALREIDDYINAPEGVDEELWQRLCASRQTKVLSELSVKNHAQNLAEMTRYLQKIQDHVGMINMELEQLYKQQTKLSEDRMRNSLNLEIQFLLKQGQVEVEAGNFLPDYNDSILIHRPVVEDLNATIKTLGDQKVMAMTECKDFNKGIHQLEWEHKRMMMHMDDLNSKARHIQMLKLGKDLQTYLSEENHQARQSKQVYALEETLALQERHLLKSIKEKHKIIKELENTISRKESANNKLAQDTEELHITVSERKNIDLVNAAEKARDTADSRLHGIVHRRKLVDLAKAQAQEVAVLRAEVERLRMKTFPALVQIER